MTQELSKRGFAVACLVLAAIVGSAPALAQDDAEDVTGGLGQGGYLAPMATYLLPQAKRLDSGLGGTLALGYRSGWWAIELAGLLVNEKADGSAEPDLSGGSLDGLLFPSTSLPNLYGIATIGGASLDHYPIERQLPGTVGGHASFSLTRLGAGVGNFFPITFGHYEMGIRAEALYVFGFRDKVVSDLPDIDAPRHFDDIVFNVGLQLPLGAKKEPAPVETPVAVVAPAAICNDTQDNDGDGLIDFPGDPGCSAADDSDETDPPQCSDGHDNDGDGLVDFPADKGCTAADDTDETDPCRTPAAGERISLKGCGLGDVIVLRGVNFEFDQSKLTVNAKTILDQVAEELNAYPDIKVEVGGHTDAKGSDEYNQALSERRAASVVKYLAAKGVAADRMSSVGYGESKPVADNETDEGRELNRRVELKITAGVAGASAATPVAAEGAATPAPEAEPASAADAAVAPNAAPVTP